MTSSDQFTLATLPFHFRDRFQRPAMVGRCREGGCTTASTQEFFEGIRALSLGLTALGLRRGDRVAIISDSRPEWVMTDLATLSAGAVTVPIYPTLSAGQARFILKESGCRIAVVSNAVQVTKLNEVVRDLPDLEAIVAMDGEAVTPRVRGVSLPDVTAWGRAQLASDAGAAGRYEEVARQVAPSDLATIVYTSGTTGDPKGVMLSHSNIVSNILATTGWITLEPEDVALSFLPLSHVFERVVFFRFLYSGVPVYFAEALTTVARDLVQVRPTVMTGVPRVFEKVHAAIADVVGKMHGPRRRLADWALEAGHEAARLQLAGESIPATLGLKRRAADRLVLGKMRARLGGRLRFVVSGSAPLSKQVGEFFFAIGLPIYEAYGLTETSPGITGNPPDAPRLGTVGKALPGVEVAIAPDGEILVRGPNVMQGYYERPEATAEVLVDGWLRTGDIGQLSADGYLTITDRKKDLIVTSGGKKIAPQPLENQLKADPLVAEAVIIGEQRKFPAALIVPDFPRLKAWAERVGLPPLAGEQLAERPEVQRLYQDILDRLNESLAQFERVKRFAVLPSEFTMERGELTPTMKVRRQVVEQRWKPLIDRLYEWPIRP
ncbi:MAG TPA: long-chain fatty acid--CoA ligase [Vicinamibacterales bacterium]|nr:long-chain fatty acid--CoA ligase [Vicinamibacterales bacterium]